MRGVVNLILPVSILIHAFFLPKKEILNPNIEIRNNHEFLNPKRIPKIVLERCLLSLIIEVFRISDFEFRVFP